MTRSRSGPSARRAYALDLWAALGHDPKDWDALTDGVEQSDLWRLLLDEVRAVLLLRSRSAAPGDVQGTRTVHSAP